MSALLPSYLTHLLEQAEEETDPAQFIDPDLSESLDLLTTLIAALEIPPPLPTKPTCLFPGSEAKVRVMAARYARGEAIFHPLDCRAEDFDHTQRRISTAKNGRVIQHDLVFAHPVRR